MGVREEQGAALVRLVDNSGTESLRGAANLLFLRQYACGHCRLLRGALSAENWNSWISVVPHKRTHSLERAWFGKTTCF